MARDATQRQLRNESAEIMRGLDEGETFIVTRNGIPVGELTPLRRHRFVSAETALAIFRSAPSDLSWLRQNDFGLRALPQDPIPVINTQRLQRGIVDT